MISLRINTGDKKNPDWQNAYLSVDASITVECINPIFDASAGGSFSYEFELDCEKNRHIVGNVDSVQGESVFNKLYGKSFQLYYDGVPILFGIIWIDRQAEIRDGEVKIVLRSNNKEWSSLLEGKGLQDLTLCDKEGHRVVVGACLPASDIGLHLSYQYKGKVFSKYSGNSKDYENYEDYVNYIKEFLKDPFAFTEKSYYTEMMGGMILDKITLPRTLFNTVVNVDKPFNPASWANPFCHIRSCMQLYKPRDEAWEKYRGYSVHEPSYNNSAPCFYVSYVLQLIIKVLGLYITENHLESVPDFNRIAIAHTNAEYYWQDEEGNAIAPLNIDDFFDQDSYKVGDNPTLQLTAKAKYHSDPAIRITVIPQSNDLYDVNAQGIITGYHQKKADYSIHLIKDQAIYEAYASNKNLPDITFQDFFDGVFNGFGAKILYDSEQGTLRIVLLRDILRQRNYEVLPCIVNERYIVQTNIRGFRLKYSSSQTHKENPLTSRIEYTSRDDDTTYNYYDYRRAVIFNKVQDDIDYFGLIKEVSDDNKNLYIDCDTGNAYRIKVDKDAGKQEEWYPSLFEVGGYRDVAIGDCSDSDYTEEVSIGFSPLVSNDVNFKKEYESVTASSRTAIFDEKKDVSPKYAMYMDAEVHAQEGSDISQPYEWYCHTCTYEDLSFGEQEIIKGVKSPTLRADCNILYSSAFCYDYTSREPFHDGDCSFTLAVLRGSGSDARRETIEYDYDGEGNNAWVQIAGSDNECTSDNVNSLGSLFDYNGVSSGIGYDKSLCLKLKAEKPYKGGRKIYSEISKKEYLEEDFLSSQRQACDNDGHLLFDKNGMPVMEPAYYPISESKAKRGLFDLFYTEYAYFTTHKKIAVFNLQMEMAELAQIDMAKKYKIGDIVGWIKKYSYTLSSERGLVNVSFELYYL